MKTLIVVALVALLQVLIGCSAEKPPEPQGIPAFVLSLADKEKLAAFQKEVLTIENFTEKALNIATEELKTVLKGGEISLNLPSIIDRAKNESLKAAEALTKKAIPEGLPPEAKRLLGESKTGFMAAYKAYAESFDAIRSFTTNKNPMALLEYRKKNAEAQEQLKGATEKLKQIMTAAGVTK